MSTAITVDIPGELYLTAICALSSNRAIIHIKTVFLKWNNAETLTKSHIAMANIWIGYIPYS